MNTIDVTDLELPIALRPSQRVTDEDLLRFSAENKPFKIERNRQGEITIMTPVGGIGSTHEAYVASSLYQWNEAMQTGIAFISNAGFKLPDHSCLSPDAAWVNLLRWNGLTPEEQEGYPPLCPDFLIEVRSRSDQRRLVEIKMQLWMENGAQLGWLIDPVLATVDIYKESKPVESLQRPEIITAGEPVLGFELRTSRLWSQR